MRVTGGRRRAAMLPRVLVMPALAAVVLAGCSQTVDGSLAGHAAPSGSGTASPIASRAHLHALLIAAPQDSVPWSDSWGRTPYPTSTQFVKRMYPASRVAENLTDLRTQGIQDITHVTWVDEHGLNVDVVLEQFRNDAGSLVRYDNVTNDGEGYDDTITLDFTDGDPTVAFEEKQRDSEGYTRAKVYAQVGDLVMEIFTFSPKGFQEAETERIARSQIAKLR